MCLSVEFIINFLSKDFEDVAICLTYCKLGNFREDFISAMFRKNKILAK